MEPIFLLHCISQYGWVKVYSIGINVNDRIIERLFYHTSDGATIKNTLNQYEEEFESFTRYWREKIGQDGTIWFTMKPVYIHTDCKTIIRESLSIISRKRLKKYAEAIEKWKNML